MQQVVQDLSSQQLTGKCNKIQDIKALRDKSILITNLQEHIPIFNQIRHIHTIGNKLVILPTNPPTPYDIGGIVKSPFIS